MGTLLVVLENLSVVVFFVIVVVSSLLLLLLLFEAKKRLSENVDSLPLKTELISPQMCTHTHTHNKPITSWAEPYRLSVISQHLMTLR